MRISVVIPVYNAKHCLHRAVDSLLNQTVQDFEIILVDDGSTDGSGELCNQYESAHQNIRTIHQENGGTCRAKNTGFALAQGEYILTIDSDDFFDRDTIETIEHIISLHHPDCLCFGLRYVIGNEPQPDAIPGLEHGKLLGEKYIHSDILPPLLNIKKDEQRFIFDFAVNKVYKRSILQEHNILFDETRRIWEDRPFVVEYLKYCNSFYSFDRAFYNYVQTTGSLSSKYYLNFFDIILENYRHYSEWYAGEYDFDNQYSNDYWCRSVENMMLRSLEQTKDCDKIHENMLRILADPQVQHWYAKRIPQDQWERDASRLVAEKKHDAVAELYRRKLLAQNRQQKRNEQLYKMKRLVKKMIGKG